jgi:hypothetical protein
LLFEVYHVEGVAFSSLLEFTTPQAWLLICY